MPDYPYCKFTTEIVQPVHKLKYRAPHLVVLKLELDPVLELKNMYWYLVNAEEYLKDINTTKKLRDLEICDLLYLFVRSRGQASFSLYRFDCRKPPKSNLLQCHGTNENFITVSR